MLEIRKIITGWAIVFSMFCLCVPAAFAENARFVFVGSDTAMLARDVKGAGGSISHGLSYYRGFVANLPRAAAEKLARKYAGSALIEEDIEVFASAANRAAKPAPPPPAEVTPWGIIEIQAPAANTYSSGLGVKVCVVDTGIQNTHPDLAGAVAGGQNFVVARGRIDPAKWADDNGHGTHVAGIIAARDNGIGVVGVAPEATLFAAKVLDRNGSGYVSAVAEGVISCVEHGAQVINMSLGSAADSTLMHDAVRYASENDLIIVAAAGNESGGVSYPAKYPEVLAVSAVDANLDFAWFSNFGSEVAFAAPGVAINSTYLGSTYKVLSGTSMAAPHVAGVAALMLSAGSQVMRARDIGLDSEQQGAGLINALDTVLNQSGP